MKYKIKELYRAAPDRLLGLEAVSLAGREELLALLSLALSEGGELPASLESGLAFWRGAGVIEGVAEEGRIDGPTDTPRQKPLRRANRLAELTADQLEPIISGEGFHGLCDSVSQLIGRMLNSTELNILAGLRTELGLSVGYILALVSFCVEEGKGTLRYVEGAAFGLVGEGVDSEEALAEHILRRRRLSTSEWKLRKLWGIGERGLSKTEQACFYRWVGEWAFDIETIGLAYDITVDSTKKADVRYTDRILESWHSKGVRSAADAQALLAAERESRAAGRARAAAAATPGRRRRETSSAALSSFDTNDMFESALRRSYGDRLTDTGSEKDDKDEG